MQRGTFSRRERVELRRMARQLRDHDPELARLLSRRGPLLPPLRLTSLPVVGYAVIAIVLFGCGLLLGVGSAVWAGLAMGGLGFLRRKVDLDARARGMHGRGAPGPRPDRTGPL